MPKNQAMCQNHDKEMKFYCRDCHVLVCVDCTVVQHKAENHELVEWKRTDFVKAASESSNPDIKALIEGLRITSQKEDKEEVKKGETENLLLTEIAAKLNATITSVTGMMSKTEERKKSVDNHIEGEFDKLNKALVQRKKDFLDKSKKIFNEKATRLRLQSEGLNSLRENVETCITATTEASEGSYDVTELLSVFTTLENRKQELTKQFEKTPLELAANDTILLAMETEALKGEIEKFGSVTKRDYKSLDSKQPIKTITSETPYHVAVHDNGDIFIPCRSKNTIDVFDLNGNHKLTFGQQENGVTFKNPLGVAIAGNALFVMEREGNVVKKLTMTGELLLTFDSGQLSHPWGCAVGPDGMVYVADTGNNRIQVFNPDGAFSHTIGSGQTSSPRAIAFDKDKNLHVALSSLNVVKVFNPESDAVVREYGKGVLNDPHGVAVDKDGYCLVGNWNGKSVCIFDPKGELVHKVGNYSNVICGVALDKDGFVFVVEYGANQVHKY